MKKNPKWAAGDVLCAVAAITTYLILTRRIGIGTDSVNYLMSADSLANGGPYIGVDGLFLSAAPPGFPASMAVLRRLGLGEIAAAKVVGALAQGIIVLSCTHVARQINRPRTPQWLPWLTGFALAIYPPLLLATGNVWSEGPFLACTCVALVFLMRVIQGPTRHGVRPWADVLLMAVSVGISVVVRTAGAFTIVLIGLWLMVRCRRHISALVFVTVASLPTAAWSAYSLAKHGLITVDRGLSAAGPSWIITRSLMTLAGWIIPDTRAQTVILGLAAGAIAVIATTTLLILGRQALGNLETQTLLFLGIGTWVLTVAVRCVTALDAPGNRLLIGAMPFLFLLWHAFANSATERGSDRRIVTALLCVALATQALGWISVPANREKHQMKELDSAILARVCSLPPDAVIVSNDWATVAYNCHRPVFVAPRTHLYASTKPVNDFEFFDSQVAGRCTALLWFDEADTDMFVPFPAVVERWSLTVQRFAAASYAQARC